MKQMITLLTVLLLAAGIQAQELSISRVSERTVEIRLGSPNSTPVLVEYSHEEKWRGSVANAPSSVDAGNLRVEIERSPLRIQLHRADGSLVQEFGVEEPNGTLSFGMNKAVFGLGENGSRFDRRGAEFPQQAARGGFQRIGPAIARSHENASLPDRR